MPKDNWILKDGNATAIIQQCAVEFCPTRPQDGITLRSASGMTWNVFQVQPIPKQGQRISEAYVRENELIVRFEESEGDTFSYQVNYRLLNPSPQEIPQAEILGVEVWLSVQTRELDAEPGLLLTAHSPANEGWTTYKHSELTSPDDGTANTDPHPNRGPAAFTADAQGEAGIWMIAASDQDNVTWLSADSDAQQQVQLFGNFMEKGVIRRARTRFSIAKPLLSTEQLARLYQEFNSSPLPLN